MSAALDRLADHWWWLLAAAMLGILEIFVPGIFLVWMASRPASPASSSRSLPIALPYQLGIFALLAFAAVYSGRRYYDRTRSRARTQCSTSARRG